MANVTFFSRRQRLGLLALGLALAVGGTPASAADPLITDEEARLPDAPVVSATRGISRGPGIRLASPDEVNARGFALRLALEPRGGARIDQASLKVSYLKQPAVDLTPRVKSGMSGNHIELPRVSVPAGSHPIRVSVRDTEGREGVLTFQLRAR
ncbi:MAG: hypothetical protein ACK5TE_10145 [Pseudomonadota bacterium]|jgi:hypothetical protein